MSYEYTDPSGIISIQDGIGAADGRVRLEVDSVALAVALIKDEDAPAVALAILEAAGYDDPDSPKDVPVALRRLKRYEAHRKLRAEREAEDAKVQEFRTAFTKAHHKGAYVPAWKDVLEADREKWRNKYRAAREFFAKEEAPEPRVIQYGDPEPDANTEWKTSSGHQIWNNGKGWLYYISHEVTPWSSFTCGAFPMTEVTGDAR